MLLQAIYLVAALTMMLAGTAAAQSNAPLARIALVADPHVSGEPQQAEYLVNFERVIEQVNAADVDAVLLAGDLTQRGDEDSLARAAALLEKFDAKVWSVAGNHDVGNKPMDQRGGTVTAGRLSQYERIVGPSFFAAPIMEGVRLVGINASLFGSGLRREAEQWTFLEQQLAQASDSLTLILTHYPLFVETPQEPDDYFNIAPIARSRLLELIKGGNVRAVLSGHLHRPIEHVVDSLPYIGAPAVSFGLPRDKQAVGWRLVTLYRDGRVESELHYLKTEAAGSSGDPVARTARSQRSVGVARAGDIKDVGPIAVLPAPDEANYVFEYFRKLNQSEQLHVLTGQQILDPAHFNVERFKVCLYLNGEQFVRSVNQNADVERALRDYTAAGGILVVLASGPYPFYLDEKGGEVASGSRLGLVFLGNEEQEGAIVGFDDPPADRGLHFAVERRAPWDALPQQLAFPSAGDQRWRPLLRPGSAENYEAWISLRDGAGAKLGDAAAWLTRKINDRPAAVAYVSCLLTQQHAERDRVLASLFADIAGRVGNAGGSATQSADTAAGDIAPPVSDRVHIFYYNWYGAPPHQGGFVHWQQGGHSPPDDIGANFYPKLGAYSSTDAIVLRQHMQWIRAAGVGVLSLTWWGRDSYEDRHALAVMDAAAEAGLQVNFHLEPYAGVTPEKIEADVLYILEQYGSHPAFYRARSFGNMPLFYVFEALRHPAAAWRQSTDRLKASGQPVLMIAQTSDLQFIISAGFDGGYPYDVLTPFRTERFLREWTERLDGEFTEAGKIFIPSVGPGYWDDRAVPNGADEPDAARTRDAGLSTTYAKAWEAAINTSAPIVTITSFNEWHEGSQIEPAVAKQISGYDYPPFAQDEMQYIRLTAEWVARFEHDRAMATPSTQPAP